MPPSASRQHADAAGERSRLRATLCTVCSDARHARQRRSLPCSLIGLHGKGAQRALFRSGATPHDDEPGALFFQRVGAGWLAPLAAGTGDRARRIAQRLPRALGEILLRERDQQLPEGERSALTRLCATIPLS